MRKQWILFLALSLASGACGKKEAPAPPPPPPQTSGSVDSLLNSSAPAPPALAAPTPPPAAAPAAAPEPPDTSGAPTGDKAVVYFNANLDNWINARDYVPTNLADLKRIQALGGGLPNLPKPPPGKELIYVPDLNNPRKSHIEFK